MSIDWLSAFLDIVAPRSTEDWQPGDLAICIADNWKGEVAESPKKDDLLRVKHVCLAGRFLHFHGKPDNLHWQAVAFRKVQPDSEPAADEAWVEQLKHMRRKVDA